MFEWQPDGYGQLLENKRQEMKDSKEATLKVHKGEVFKTGVIPKRLKHENLLGDQDVLPYKFFESDDAYDLAKQEVY